MAHDHEIYMILTDTAAELRDLDALHKYAPIIEQLASRDNHRLYLAIARRALGVSHRLAGQPSEAEHHLRQALDLFTKLGTRWQIGRTLFELGALHSTATQEKAREYYSQALAAFEEIRSAPYAERTRLVLNEVS
jgi:tetratricopeptide (TPR) repeat protein